MHRFTNNLTEYTSCLEGDFIVFSKNLTGVMATLFAKRSVGNMT